MTGDGILRSIMKSRYLNEYYGPSLIPASLKLTAVFANDLHVIALQG